jgi:hypothetical protein
MAIDYSKAEGISQMMEHIFKMIEELIDISAFELEYRHRLDNPFNEKWLNTSRTRDRIIRVRKFLYQHICIVLQSNSGESFYNLALRGYFKVPLYSLMQDIRSAQNNQETDPLYRLLLYKISLEELFIVYTNLVTWEHSHFPHILENMIFKEYMIVNNQLIESGDIFKYYIRVLDLLSSTAIVSLFDLDALKNTILTDKQKIGTQSLSQLRLFKDWPLENMQPFDQRFPGFREKIEQKFMDNQQLNWN